MATRDFRTQQIRTTQIIASGSDTTSKPSLLIYSASDASNDQGGVAGNLLTAAGTDTWLFVSGSTRTADNRQVLFGGNVVVSGSLSGSSITGRPGQSLAISSDDSITFTIDADGGSTSTFSFKSGATEVAELNESGDLQVDGDITVSGNDIKGSAGTNITLGGSGEVSIVGNLNVPSTITHTGDTDTKIGFDANEIKITAGNVDALTTNATSHIINEDYGEFDLEVRGDTTNKRIIHTDGSNDTIKFLDTNDTSLDALNHRDVSFYVKGIPGAHDSYVVNPTGASGRGVALFTGDVVVSGTLYAEKQVLDVDLSQDGELILSSSLHLKNSGAGFGTNLPVPPLDGSLFVATGSLIAKLADAGGNTTEVKIGQNYLAGNGLSDVTVNPNTTFHSSIDAFTGTLTSGLVALDSIAVMDASEPNNATKKMTLANFFTDTAENGIKYDSTSIGYKTDDAIVAHLTGSEFSGPVGVTGSLGVVGDLTLAQNNKQYFNGINGDVFIVSSDGNSLDIDGDNFVNLISDTSVIIKAGDNEVQVVSTGGTTLNTNRDAAADFSINTDNKFKTVFVDSGDESIILGAADFTATGVASDLLNKGYGNDVKILLSGTLGSKDTGTRGVVQASGDMVVSGTLFFADNTSSESYLSNPRNGLSRDINSSDRAVELSLQNISGSASIAVGDSLAFIDADASNATKKGTVSSLVTAIAGDGLSNVSDQLQVNVDNSTLERNSDALRVKDNGIVAAKIATSVAGNGLTGGGGAALAADLTSNGGLKFDGSNRIQTDDKYVAHLTGSEFGGPVGVTGSFGVVGDISLAVEDYLYLNGLDGDVRLRGYANSLDIDGDDTITLLSDTNTQIRAGVNSTNFTADRAEFNTNNEDVDFEVNTNTYNATLFVDGADESIILGAQNFTTTPSASDLAAKGYGADVKIMLSGSKNTMGTATRGVVLVPGDLVVSGTLADGTGRRINLLSVAENGTFSTAPIASGVNAVAIGNRAVASGDASIVLGTGVGGNNTAAGISAVVLGGENVSASGNYSAILGGQNNTITGAGLRSVAIGSEHNISSEDSTAIGYQLTVPEDDTIAIGNSSNNAKVAVSGSLKVTSTSTFSSNATFLDDVFVDTYIKNRADTNTWIRFNTDRIRFATHGATRIDVNNAGQVLILTGAAPTGNDINFFVSGTIGSKDTTVKGTSVFGGDLHISGALSGPSSYALTDNSVRMFRDGNIMKFVDGQNGTSTLQELASVAASVEHFIGDHGNGAQNSKLKTSASIAFAGDLNDFVSNLANKGVGTDVYFFVSGTLGTKDHALRHVSLFGGDVVVSGSSHLVDITGSYIKSTGPIVAAGNVIKNSNNDTVMKFHSSVAGVMFGGTEGLPQTSVDIRIADDQVIASGADGNDYSNYNLALRNNSTTTNAFAGIAFDVHDEDDADSIGASIAVLRDSTADGTNHDANMVFMTNDAGDDGLTERLRITHDGKIGIGVVSPSRALDINGDLMIRGNNILDSGGADVITFDGSQNTALTGDLTITGGDLVFGNAAHATGSVAASSGTNTVGKNLSIQAGAGTGNAAGGTLDFKVAAPGSSGTGVNPHTTLLSLSPSTGFSTFGGFIQIPNNDGIKNGDGETVLTIDADQGVDIEGILQVKGNKLQGSAGQNIHLSGSGAVGIEGNLQVSGNSIKDSGNNTVLTFDGSGGISAVGDFSVATLNIQDLKVGGDDIKDSGNNTVISFDGSGNIDNAVTFSGNQVPVFAGNNGVQFANDLRHEGDLDTQIRFSTDQINLEAGGTPFLKVKNTTQNVVIFNENGTDTDFRMEALNTAGAGTPAHGNVDADHAFFLQGSTGQIGLGVNSIDSKTRLQIKGMTTTVDPVSSKFWSQLTGSQDDGRLDLYANNAVTARINANGMSMLGGDGTNEPSLLIVRRDGTTTENELLGGIGFDSSDGNVPGTILNASAFIAAYAAEDHSQNDKGGYLVIGTSAIDDNDDTASVERLRIADNGLITISNNLKINGGGIQDSELNTALFLSGSGNVGISGSLTAHGGTIQGGRDGTLTIKSDTDLIFQIDSDSDGGETFQFKNGAGTEIAVLDEAGNLQIDADITVSGNVIRASDGGSTITMDTSDNVTIGGDLTVTGGDVIGVNLKLDASGDITLSADGDQIKMDDGTTTRFTFNVDSTPELDVVGQFTIDCDNTIVLASESAELFISGSTENTAITLNACDPDAAAITFVSKVTDTHNSVPVFMKAMDSHNLANGVNGLYSDGTASNAGPFLGNTLSTNLDTFNSCGRARFRDVGYRYPSQINTSNNANTGEWEITNGTMAGSRGLMTDYTAVTHFDAGSSGADRILQTKYKIPGGMKVQIHFYLSIGDSTPESSEDLYLQYSVDESTWIDIAQYDESAYDDGLTAGVEIDIDFSSPPTGDYYLRWAQLSHSGAGNDNWEVSAISIRENEHTLTNNYAISIENSFLKGGKMKITANFIQFMTPNGLTIGSITAASSTPGTVVYSTFTGGHSWRLKENATFEEFMIGKITSIEGPPEEPIYVCEPTTSANDKAAIGVLMEDVMWNEDGTEYEKVRTLPALGNYKMLVCSEGGNIEIGDYITSSNTKGAGMKQSSDDMKNYTIGKASQNVDWSSEPGSTKIIPCILLGG